MSNRSNLIQLTIGGVMLAAALAPTQAGAFTPPHIPTMGGGPRPIFINPNRPLPDPARSYKKMISQRGFIKQRGFEKK